MNMIYSLLVLTESLFLACAASPFCTGATNLRGVNIGSVCQRQDSATSSTFDEQLVIAETWYETWYEQYEQSASTSLKCVCQSP